MIGAGTTAKREARSAYLFLTPGLALFFLFTLIPVAAALYFWELGNASGVGSIWN